MVIGRWEMTSSRKSTSIPPGSTPHKNGDEGSGRQAVPGGCVAAGDGCCARCVIPAALAERHRRHALSRMTPRSSARSCLRALRGASTAPEAHRPLPPPPPAPPRSMHRLRVASVIFMPSPHDRPASVVVVAITTQSQIGGD